MCKKLLSFILIINSSLLLMGTAAFAAPIIAVVDTQKIIMQSGYYDAIKNADEEIKKLEKQLQDDMMSMDKQLEEARKKGESQAELTKMREKFEQDIYEKRLKAQELLKTKQSELEKTRDKLRKDVEAAIKEIASQKKIEMVIDKQAVFFGGMDITDEVAKKIKK